MTGLQRSVQPSEITVSPDERMAQSLHTENMAAALQQLRDQGYLIVRDVFEPAMLEDLRARMQKEWTRFRDGKPAWRGGGKIIGHINIVPPKCDAFINNTLLAHPIIHAITSAMLGPSMSLTGIGGNANLPGSVDQYFHSDLDTPDPRKLMVNIPLGDVDERNGSLELIPAFDQDPARAIRANTSSGSVIIRHLHLLHRGKRNPSKQPRFMLGYWLTAIDDENRARERLILDPNRQDLLGACIQAFENLGLPEPQPVFQPNYFTPTAAGLFKELVYRAAPGPYLLAVRGMKKLCGR